MRVALVAMPGVWPRRLGVCPARDRERRDITASDVDASTSGASPTRQGRRRAALRHGWCPDDRDRHGPPPRARARDGRSPPAMPRRPARYRTRRSAARAPTGSGRTAPNRSGILDSDTHWLLHRQHHDEWRHRTRTGPRPARGTRRLARTRPMRPDGLRFAPPAGGTHGRAGLRRTSTHPAPHRCESAHSRGDLRRRREGARVRHR